MQNPKASHIYLLLLLGSGVLWAAAVGGCSHSWDDFRPPAGASGGGLGGAAGGQVSMGTTSASGGGEGGVPGGTSGGGGAGGQGTGGEGGGTPLGCARPNSIAGLQATFDGAQLGRQWIILPASSVAIAQNNGDLTLAATDMTPNQWGGIVTSETYDLRDCAVFIKLTQPFDLSSSGYVYLNVANDRSEEIELAEVSGTLELKRRRRGEVLLVAARVPYVPAEQLYFRIAERSDVTYWDASPDGINWQNLYMEANDADFSVVHVSIGGGTLATSGTAAPGTARFDSVNVLP